MFGCGFWARFQLAAWNELPEVECVALYNRTRSKAVELAKEFSVPNVYSDAGELFRNEKLDFVDIVTDASTHEEFLQFAASHHVPAICQKPFCLSLAEAEKHCEKFASAGLPLFIHENWRWQRPIRVFARILRENWLGTPFRCRIDMITGFPVFENQPSLRNADKLILLDLGTHILDVARFLFGETESLYCVTHRVQAEIAGEDAATVVMNMNQGRTTVVCNLAYAGNALERDPFPETQIFVEADRGSLELAPGHSIRVTTPEGTFSRCFPPKMYSWVDPAYAVVQSSIVDCHADLLRGFREKDYVPETCASDNLKSLRLVFDAYKSAHEHSTIRY